MKTETVGGPVLKNDAVEATLRPGKEGTGGGALGLGEKGRERGSEAKAALRRASKAMRECARPASASVSNLRRADSSARSFQSSTASSGPEIAEAFLSGPLGGQLRGTGGGKVEDGKREEKGHGGKLREPRRTKQLRHARVTEKEAAGRERRREGPGTRGQAMGVDEADADTRRVLNDRVAQDGQEEEKQESEEEESEEEESEEEEEESEEEEEEESEEEEEEEEEEEGATVLSEGETVLSLSSSSQSSYTSLSSSSATSSHESSLPTYSISSSLVSSDDSYEVDFVS
jgi:hypothetical protein